MSKIFDELRTGFLSMEELSVEDKGLIVESLINLLTKKKSPNLRPILMACYSLLEESFLEISKSHSRASTARNNGLKGGRPRKLEKRFKKPTTGEIKAYCEARSNSVDPDNFYDFYESKAWKIGKSPMKCWKSAVRTWERRSFNNTPPPKKERLDKDILEGFIVCE